MLEKVVLVDTSDYDTYYDFFDGNTLGDDWTAASWTDGAPAILPDDLGAVATTNTSVGAVLDAQSVTTASQYEVAAWLAPYENAYWGNFSLYGNMNNTTPIATTDGWVANLVMTDGLGTFSGTLKTYKAGVLQHTFTFTTTNSPLGYNPAGWFRVLVNGTTLTVKWMSETLINARNISGDLGAAAGARVGFGIEASEASGIGIVGAFRQVYYNSSPRREPRELLVASANGALWYENVTGMSALSTSLTLASDHRIRATDALQKLYIADWCAPVASGTNGVVSSGTTFDSASYADWTATGANANDYVLVLSGGTGALTAGTYTIATVAAGTITLNSAPGNDTGVTFSLERAPKIYDPSAGTLTLLTATAAKGQVPSGARHVCYYRGRLCFAKDHVCYQSRVDDFQDWLYSDTDVEGAVATTAADGTRGQIGDILTALIPMKDDRLIYGARNSIWEQVGDVRLGGEINNITHDYGILPDAWCYLPNGGLVFMSQNAMYAWSPAGGPPQNISEDKLPNALKDIDPERYNICMEYDHREGGIHLFLTAETADDREHWWFDMENKGFWPVQLADNDEPFSICKYNGHLIPYNTVLLGGRNGYIRMFHDDFDTDGATSITSYVKIGPIKPGSMGDGRLDELAAVLAEDSGQVTWEIMTADTPEGAVEETTAFDTGTWSAGLNYTDRPRCRGGAVVLKLSGAEDQRWALERIAAVIAPLGRLRKA